MIDPETDEVRYVGQSVCAWKRFIWHRMAAKSGRGKDRMYRWYRSLLAEGREPRVRVVELVEESRADEAEAETIDHYLLQGVDLTNCTAGGGGRRGAKHSEETKRKIGAAHRAKVVSDETRRRISASKRGAKLSEEAKAAISAGLRGMAFTDERKAAISARMMGNRNGKGPTHAMRERASVRWAGENSFFAKLTNEQAREIRDLAARGAVQRDLAKKFGVTPATVSRIVARKIFKTA